jgi:hypothetical protein
VLAIPLAAAVTAVPDAVTAADAALFAGMATSAASAAWIFVSASMMVGAFASGSVAVFPKRMPV